MQFLSVKEVLTLILLNVSPIKSGHPLLTALCKFVIININNGAIIRINQNDIKIKINEEKTNSTSNGFNPKKLVGLFIRFKLFSFRIITFVSYQSTIPCNNFKYPKK